MAQNLAVDLMLRTLMSSLEFRESEKKNWEGVAKLIPGSSAQQVCIRPNSKYKCKYNNSCVDCAN